MLIHTVFFWLKPELTAAQRAEFRRGVESLAAIKHAAEVHVGAPAVTPDRPVVDKTFAVGLTVICRTWPPTKRIRSIPSTWRLSPDSTVIGPACRFTTRSD